MSKEEEKLVFFQLLPWVFAHLDFVCVANPLLIRLAVQGASSSQVLGLSLSGTNIFFGDDNDAAVVSCLAVMREWDEGDFLWGFLLFTAERNRVGGLERSERILAAAFKDDGAEMLPPMGRLLLLGMGAHP